MNSLFCVNELWRFCSIYHFFRTCVVVVQFMKNNCSVELIYLCLNHDGGMSLLQHTVGACWWPLGLLLLWAVVSRCCSTLSHWHSAQLLLLAAYVRNFGSCGSENLWVFIAMYSYSLLSLYRLRKCNAPWLIHLLIPALYKLFTYLLPYLFTSLRIGPFCQQAGVRKRWPKLAVVSLCVYSCYYNLYFVIDACLHLY